MLIKFKSALVIIISSFVIASVLLLTVFGFYAYLEWRKKETENIYKTALYELNAHLFERYIMLSLRAKISAEGGFKGSPVAEGTVENASGKTLYSLKLKIAFSDQQDRVLYLDRFYPVGGELDALINIGSATKNFLGSGDSVFFSHRLKNCPPEVTNHLKSELDFVRAGAGYPLKFTFKIEGLDIR